MKRKIEGVTEEILKCAEKEFLEKGFIESSLREIAKNSGVSTSSIYTRFGDKEGLFEAVVSDVIQDLNTWFQQMQQAFHNLPVEMQVRDLFVYSADKIGFLVDYIYDHFSIFKLLVMKSEGTKYSTFLNDFVDVDVEYTIKYIEAIDSNVLSSGRLTPELLHILSSGFYTGIIETVVHDMRREDAYIYVKKLRRFYVCGWKDIFDNNESEVL